jgi:ribonuclease R
MSEELDERIMRFVSGRHYQPQRIESLAESMGIERSGYGAFRETVKSLSKSGRVVFGTGQMVMLPEPAGRIQGVYRANPRGFGFVVPTAPSHADLFIPEGESLDAITGDTVIAKVLRKGKRGDKTIYEGRIVEVVERGNSRFVGRLHNQSGKWFVVADGNVLHVPILVDDVGAKNARANDQVVVELLTYPSPRRPARGVIVERLGKAGAPGVDLLSVIRQFHLPGHHEKPVLSAAGAAARACDTEADLKHRQDFREMVTVTIDPDDARDFDDAITLHKVRGGWELGVHIADVSHFVRPGDVVDAEARRRGNSVYLLGHVIPMLPEVLSNGVCSLQEGVDRLVLSAFIRYDRQGVPQSSRFASGVIRSNKRLTYGQATGILEGKTAGFDGEVVRLVKEMEVLARVIQKRRQAEGMLVLDLADVDLILDEKGRVIDARPEDISFSHTVIEMFMVEANEAVARLLDRLKVPFLRRIHPDPDALTRDALVHFVKVVGYQLPKVMNRSDVQRLLAAVKGSPGSFAVNLAVLRSMMPAEYSPKGVGHYALASQHYTHFTSPIRRYPDLTIHRLLRAHLNNRLSPADRSAHPSRQDLEELGTHCSFTERQAEGAERDLKTVKILQLLESKVGQRFPGVVTGVANSGVFVQVSPYRIDGLVRFDNLADDWWEVDRRTGCAVGQRTGRRITIGDLVEAEVMGVNVAGRQLDLAIARFKSGPVPEPRKTSPSVRSGTGRGSGLQGDRQGRRRRGRRGKPGAAHKH